MMRYILFVAVIFFLPGCDEAQKSNEKTAISVSILPQKYFIERIAGEHFNINVMIPGNASPATYEPTPQQLKELGNSSTYFMIGHLGFERAWVPRFRASNDLMNVINLSYGLDLITGHYHDGPDAGIDPHVWMSPANCLEMSKSILYELIRLSPEKKNEFQKNFLALEQDIRSTDSWIREQFSGIKNRKFLIFHPALSYYSKEYDLTQISLEEGGKEPSVKHMKEVIGMAKDEGLKDILVQKQFDIENARSVADELGGKVIQINPLGYDWIEEIRDITKKLAESMKWTNE